MNRIPKKIHYCWFGKQEMPERFKKILKVGKKYLPDYGIIECNENNFLLSKNTIENVDNTIILPQDYINPKGGYEMAINVTKSTISIYHCEGSWFDNGMKRRENKIEVAYSKYNNKKRMLLCKILYSPYKVWLLIKENIQKVNARFLYYENHEPIYIKNLLLKYGNKI